MQHVDGDGDLDAVYAFLAGHDLTDRLAWSENLDGEGEFGDQHIVDTFSMPSVILRRLLLVDIDLDGDSDLVSTGPSTRELPFQIAWYENTDGLGTFGPRNTIVSFADFGGLPAAGDVDGDGDLDIAFAEFDKDTIIWYENLGIPGDANHDANHDGQFDSADLVMVFKAGEYEDAIEGNSSFEEGDWNGDGDFTSADLVLRSNPARRSRKANPQSAPPQLTGFSSVKRLSGTDPSSFDGLEPRRFKSWPIEKSIGSFCPYWQKLMMTATRTLISARPGLGTWRKMISSRKSVRELSGG